MCQGIDEAFSRREEKKRREQEKKRQETIEDFTSKINDALFQLDHILVDMWCSPSAVHLDDGSFETLQELLPLFPISEALSLQADITSWQTDILLDHIALSMPRYNYGQFVEMSLRRNGAYPQWYALAGLDSSHCGQIWRTLTELFVRVRDDSMSQKIIDQIGEIFIYFAALGLSNIDFVHLRWKKFIETFNKQANELVQKDPYINSVATLQERIAAAFGGRPEEFIPLLDDTLPFPASYGPVLKFRVRKVNDKSFGASYAVRKFSSPSELSLIWNIPDKEDLSEPTVFFAEDPNGG